MIHFINRGAVVTIPDLLHPGEYKQFRNPEWDELPEIISFTEFLDIIILVRLVMGWNNASKSRY